MKLSIITICYNDKVGFEKTAQSVISQTCLTDVEWIIVDGASTDGTVDAIKQYVEASKKVSPQTLVSWKSEPDRGIYNAMNKGIGQANGEYLLFLNSGDSLYNENVLEYVLPFLDVKDIYVGDIANDYDGRIVIDEFPRILSTRTILNQIIFKLIPHQATFIKSELFVKYGFYREDLRIASDWFFFYKTIVMNGASIKTIPLPIAIFDMTGISSTDKNRVNERITSQNGIPCQQELFCFYKNNVELITAINNSIIGRLIVRLYFLLYRKVLNKV